jgi:integrase
MSLSRGAAFLYAPVLLVAAIALIMSSLATSTMSGYAASQRRFFNFGTGHGVPDSEMLPPSELTLIAFATFLFEREGASHGAVQRALCGVKSCCKFLGLSVAGFASAQLELLLRAMKKKRGPKKRPSRLPITIPILSAMITLLRKRKSTVVLRAALAMGVYGLMRAGEFCFKKGGDVLARSDVRWFPSKVVITLRESKTDVFREGVEIQLFKNDSHTCPYTLLRKAWDRAPLKRPDAPLLQNADGSPFTYLVLQARLKAICKELGWRGSITAHSLRIGGATSLAMLGYPASTIRTLGRWRSLSYQLYLRLQDSDFAGVSNAFGSMPEAQGAIFSPSAFGGISTAAATDVSFENIDTVFGGSQTAASSAVVGVKR